MSETRIFHRSVRNSSRLLVVEDASGRGRRRS
jgi:hypothetical protein